MKHYGANQYGFTLLELMLVVALIGVSIGAIVVVINPNDFQRDLQKEALHLQTLLKLITDDAIFKRKEIGIKVYDDHLEFLFFNERGQSWEKFSNGKSQNKDYVNFKFPSYATVTLEMEDAEIFLNPKRDDIESKISAIDPLKNFDELEEEEEEIEPDIYIFSSGEITAFEFEFRLKEDTSDEFGGIVYIVGANDIGIVSCKAPHHEDEKCY